ncbi:hypothetical protein HMPREF9306_01184 [Propionimicrobium lymphophilum ACS-093-V-SCH5]|uniref:Uncharacterized protein n=1 Tax=Propionimicrobium lymphophilum ACS-093-V-SCH5 TaxID=883161 RepID=S2W160_9ACTN|nr:hypothetical protein HMPREF9306_01184 [Propionimicrobium lymphophilum ACS-093-V-SCH5]
MNANKKLSRKVKVETLTRKVYICQDCDWFAEYDDSTGLATCYFCGTVWGWCDGEITTGMIGEEYDMNVYDVSGEVIETVPFSKAKAHSKECTRCRGTGFLVMQGIGCQTYISCGDCEGHGWIPDPKYDWTKASEEANGGQR